MTFKQSFRVTSIVAIALITATTSVFALFSSQTAQAVSPSDWKPGRIIDDAVFYNKNSMSAAQIQDFLNAKVPNCNRWRSTTNTANQPPYTCLKEYQENTTTKENNIGRFNSNGSPYQVPGGKSAAQIIWEVGQQYGINPQVLIVMLQKEQSLITDDWPWRVQYQKAMGYACPDTAPCDEQYYGFYNQVDSAAWQMKRYIEYPNSFNFKAGVTRNILWSPNTSCGSSPVFIENSATAALYNYTPYQPNAAAVNNLYGTGDGCSAYGNRNFWRMFNDWFGSTLNANYSWEWAGQNIYTNNTKSVWVDANNSPLQPNTKYYAVIKAKNIGSATWQKGNFRLGTNNPINRMSALCDASWVNCGRTSSLVEESVAPGQTGTFEFWFNTPGPSQQVKEYFNPLQEGVVWLNDIGLHLNFRTASYSWEWAGQNIYTNNTKSVWVDANNSPLQPNTKYYAVIKAKNIGSATWQKGNFRLGTNNPINRMSALCDASWVNCGRTSSLVEESVAPGQTGTFEFWFNTPGPSQQVKEYFNPLQEGVVWLNDIGLHLNFRTASYSWEWAGQNIYTNNTKSVWVDANNSPLQPNTKYYAVIKAKNIGSATWQKGNFRLGTNNPINRMSALCDASWVNCGRTSSLVEESVAPGQTGTFEFWFNTPGPSQQVKEYFNPLQEGVVWLNDIGLHLNFRTAK